MKKLPQDPRIMESNTIERASVMASVECTEVSQEDTMEGLIKSSPLGG